MSPRRRRLARRGAIGIVVVGALVGVSVASAYVRSTTSTATPIEWRDICPHLRLSATENRAFPHGDVRPILERSLENWTEKTAGCTALDVAFLDDETEIADVGYDSTNAILWRLPGFCDDPANATEEVCLSPNAAAITTVFYIDKPGAERDGEIVEADIVMNATHHRFDAGEQPEGLDLESVMTHELGHFLGLGHTCHTARGEAPPMNDDGEPVPFCFPTTELDEATTKATMYNFVGPGETDKRSPADDEWGGLCEIYADHPGVCTDDRPGCGSGCVSSSGGAGSGAILVLAAGLIAACRARRRAALLIGTLSVTATGCVDFDVATQVDEAATKDTYEQQVAWEQPRPCDIFLHERILDEELRLVQYTAAVGEREYGILYEVDDASELPLRVTAYSLDWRESITIEASDRDLRVLGSDGGMAYEVTEYDEAPPGSRVSRHGELAGEGALHLLGCALPARTELGAVPAFLRNRADGGRVPDAPDVVAQPETVPEILDWNGDVTILGAFFLESACAGNSTWRCPCLGLSDPVVGEVPGWCNRPPWITPEDFAGPPALPARTP